MPAERYFYEGPLVERAEICLEGDEHHHLANVMRGRIGDLVEIMNGRSQLAKATIADIEKRCTLLSIETVLSETNPLPPITLLQALPKSSRLETIIEKCTELGVAEFKIFPGARSEKKQLFDNQMKRLQSIAISASKQSGRLTLPTILLGLPIEKWEEMSEDRIRVFGDLRPEAPLLMKWLTEALQQSKEIPLLSLCIGPESGFTDSEITLLEKKGFKGVRLHSNILRTDTASIACLSIVSHMLSA